MSRADYTFHHPGLQPDWGSYGAPDPSAAEPRRSNNPGGPSSPSNGSTRASTGDSILDALQRGAGKLNRVAGMLDGVAREFEHRSTLRLNASVPQIPYRQTRGFAPSRTPRSGRSSLLGRLAKEVREYVAFRYPFLGIADMLVSCTRTAMKHRSGGQRPYSQQYYPGVPPDRDAPQQWGLPPEASWPSTSSAQQWNQHASPYAQQPAYMRSSAPLEQTSWSPMPQSPQASHASGSTQASALGSSAISHAVVGKRLDKALSILREPLPILPMGMDDTTLKEARQTLDAYKSEVAEATRQLGRIEQGVRARFDGEARVPLEVKKMLEDSAHALKSYETDLVTMISEVEAQHRDFTPNAA